MVQVGELLKEVESPNVFQTCPSVFSSGGDLHVVRENVGPEESEHEEELQQGKKMGLCI